MIEQNIFTIIFGVFLLLSCRDMFFGHSSADVETHIGKPMLDNLPGLDTDSMQMTSPYGIPTIKILYCHSCGYRQAFEEVSKLIQANFDGIKIDGRPHQPGWLRAQIVNLLFFTKIALIAMIYMDFNPFTYLQMETPGLWNRMMQNKISSSLIILFVASTIDGKMMSTGAFEVFYNDNIPIWSKLQTGRMPSAPELLQAIKPHYDFGVKSKVGEFVPT